MDKIILLLNHIVVQHEMKPTDKYSLTARSIMSQISCTNNSPIKTNLTKGLQWTHILHDTLNNVWGTGTSFFSIQIANIYH